MINFQAGSSNAAGDGADRYDDAVTVAVLPDSQTMTRFRPETYLEMTRWLAKEIDHLGIDLLLHVGDVVDGGADDETQFEVAAKAHQQLYDSGVPMLVAPGNHDYDDKLMQSRAATMFNQYLGWGALRNQEWFGGSPEQGSGESSFALVDTPGRRLLALALEFGPRPETLAWADDVLSAHADRAAFMVTHSYLDPDAQRTSHRSRWHPRSHQGAPDSLDGAEIWQQLISRHDNVVAVFSGHQIPGIVSHRVDQTDGGQGVLQTFQNWQCAPPHLAACFRLVRWFPASGRATLQVINASTGLEEQGDGFRAEVQLGSGAPHQRWPQIPTLLDTFEP